MPGDRCDSTGSFASSRRSGDRALGPSLRHWCLPAGGETACRWVSPSARSSATYTGTDRALVVAGRRVAVIADSAVGLEPVRWTVGAGATAGLGYVTDPGGRPTHGGAGLVRVGRAVGARPRARLGHITDPSSRATDGSTGLEGVGRTEGTRSRARLGHITEPGGRATDRGRRLKLTRGRATDARFPVIGSQIALLTRIDGAVAALCDYSKVPITCVREGGITRTGDPDSVVVPESLSRRNRPVIRPTATAATRSTGGEGGSDYSTLEQLYLRR